MSKSQVTVICRVPRSGNGLVLDKGDEWTIGVRRAARLIAAGQVKLKDEADAPYLPEIVAPVAPTAAPQPAPLPPGDDADDFDESDAIADPPAAAAAPAPVEAEVPKEPKTALGKAKAKRAAGPKK